MPMNPVYSRAIQWYSKHKDQLDVKVGEHTLRFNTKSKVAKKWFYPRYLFGQTHEPEVTLCVSNDLNNNGVFLDIGANLGWFTVLAGHICTKGSVHVFELDPALVTELLETLSLNHIEAEIVINPVAAYESTGRVVEFSPHHDDNRSTNRVVQCANTSKARVKAVTLTIDDYCAQGNVWPTFIKLDVEGAEGSVVRGMRNTLSKCQPKLLLEIHPKQLREVGYEAGQVVQSILETVPDYKVRQVLHYRCRSGGKIIPFEMPAQWGEEPIVLYFFI